MAHKVVNIDPMLAAFRTIPEFVETPYLVGNLMARIRMTILYYHANRDNRIVCGTSNRSEYMLGYAPSTVTMQPISSRSSTCTRQRSTWLQRSSASRADHDKGTLRRAVGRAE